MNLNRRQTSFFIFIALIFVLTLIWFIGSSVFPVGWDFQNNLWAPAHLLLQGESPYRIQDMIPGSNAVWMPMIISLLLPIGWLPVQQASNLWLLFNMIFLFVVIGVFVRTMQQGKLYWFAGITLLFVLFPPVLTIFFFGQVSLMICVILLLIALYWEHLPPAILGLLFAVSFTKPQLAVFFIPVWCIVLWRQQRKKQLFQSLLFTGIWIVVLLGPFFLIFPHWTDDFFVNLSTNKDWAHPSIITYLIHWLPINRYFIIFPILLIGGVSTGYLAIRLSPPKALFWSLALTPLFSPYIWSWDFVLLFPLLLETIFDGTKTKRWFVLGSFLLVEGVYFVMKANGNLSEFLFWWVPWVIVIVLMIGNIKSKTALFQKDTPTAPTQL